MLFRSGRQGRQNTEDRKSLGHRMVERPSNRAPPLRDLLRPLDAMKMVWCHPTQAKPWMARNSPTAQRRRVMKVNSPISDVFRSFTDSLAFCMIAKRGLCDSAKCLRPGTIWVFECTMNVSNLGRTGLAYEHCLVLSMHMGQCSYFFFSDWVVIVWYLPSGWPRPREARAGFGNQFQWNGRCEHPDHRAPLLGINERARGPPGLARFTWTKGGVDPVHVWCQELRREQKAEGDLLLLQGGRTHTGAVPRPQAGATGQTADHDALVSEGFEWSLRSMQRWVGPPDIAEMRFAAVRSPRCWVSGYGTKWRIQGQFS